MHQLERSCAGCEAFSRLLPTHHRVLAADVADAQLQSNIKPNGWVPAGTNKVAPSLAAPRSAEGATHDARHVHARRRKLGIVPNALRAGFCKLPCS